MTEIITILNQKGGCGKTTTAVNLSAALTKMDKKVLIVDMDPQANATSSLGIDKNNIETSVYDLITEKCEINDVIYETSMENLHSIPSNKNLTDAEVELSKEIGYPYILNEKLENNLDYYDYVIIDAPPSLGILTLNGLVAADSLIIPIQAEYFALEGMLDLLGTIKLVENRLKSACPIKGILLTLYDKRTKLAREVEFSIKDFFKGEENIFKTKIPRNVKLAEAPSAHQPCITYDPECIGTKAYMKLAKEIISLEGE